MPGSVPPRLVRWAAILLAGCVAKAPPKAPPAPPPVPIAAGCEALVQAKAEAFDGTAEDSFPTTNERLNDGRCRFAEVVNTLGDSAIPCLRSMIEAERIDSAFLFQAATILIERDPSEESLKAAADALSRVDLGKVQRFIYVDDVVQLARHDIDTGALAEKYMVYPKVDDVMPTRITASEPNRLGRDYAAIFLYGTMLSARADECLTRILARGETCARSSAALALCFNATPASFKALRALERKEQIPLGILLEMGRALTRIEPPVIENPTHSRDEVVEALKTTIEKNFCIEAGDEAFLLEAGCVLLPEDVDLIREARRRNIQHVHEASLGGYLYLTNLLYAVINRYDLYKEDRHP